MRTAFPALLAALLAVAPAAAEAANWVTTPGGGGSLYNVPVKSVVELRFERVVRQGYDLSCGAAALATLFTYFYRDETDERQIIERVFEFGDKDKISRDGFSMLELKHYAEDVGYVAQGFRIDDVSNLEKIKIPYITLIEVRGYNHFVVVKTVSEGKVYIADPAFGNRTMGIESFEVAWNNIVLGVMSAANAGDSSFGVHGTLKARMGEVKNLIDYGLRPLQPSAGSFR